MVHKIKIRLTERLHGLDAELDGTLQENLGAWNALLDDGPARLEDYLDRVGRGHLAAAT